MKEIDKSCSSFFIIKTHQNTTILYLLADFVNKWFHKITKKIADTFKA